MIDRLFRTLEEEATTEIERGALRAARRAWKRQLRKSQDELRELGDDVEPSDEEEE